jgi:hypothetical protein
LNNKFLEKVKKNLLVTADIVGGYVSTDYISGYVSTDYVRQTTSGEKSSPQTSDAFAKD